MVVSLSTVRNGAEDERQGAVPWAPFRKREGSIAVCTRTKAHGLASNAIAPHKAEGARALLKGPKTPVHLYSGKTPGHSSATGFPVRSYHLSGLLEVTAVKGELLHLTNTLFYSIAAGLSTREECFPRRVRFLRNDRLLSTLARAGLKGQNRGYPQCNMHNRYALPCQIWLRGIEL